MTTKVTGSVLADTAVTAGTYGGTQTLQAFTVDAQGRITYAANITSGVITAGTRGQGADIIVPTIQYNALGQIVAGTNTTIRTATTSVTGVVQLADSVSNTSTTAAATASAVKTAYDAAINALNASNISSGTLPSARISGSYTGITGVGTLAAGSIPTSLITGLASSATTDTTSATNITSGTLPAARLSGSYTGITGVGTLSAGSIPTSLITGLATSATTDTTNAGNITSGTLPAARISGSYTGITGIGTLTTGSIPGSLISSAVSSATNATNVSGTATVTVANLATAAKPIGASQTWQDMTASRSYNVTYTNDTGRPIMVNIMVGVTVNQYVEILIGGSVVVSKVGWNSFASGQVLATASAIIPAGNTYQATSSGTNSMAWAELR